MISALVPEVVLKFVAVKFDDEADDEVLTGAGCKLPLSVTTASLLTGFLRWNTAIASCLCDHQLPCAF